jgi:hypothetical protein
MILAKENTNEVLLIIRGRNKTYIEVQNYIRCVEAANNMVSRNVVAVYVKKKYKIHAKQS